MQHNQDPVTSRVIHRINEFLQCYAKNDQEGVLALLDPVEFLIFGSDISEIVTSTDSLRTMMVNDFALWQSAEFGAIENLNIRCVGDLATAFFHVPFSAAGGPAIRVRVCMTWRYVSGEWLLTQSANTVPTSDSSAADLLSN